MRGDLCEDEDPQQLQLQGRVPELAHLQYILERRPVSFHPERALKALPTKTSPLLQLETHRLTIVCSIPANESQVTPVLSGAASSFPCCHCACF